MESSSRSSFSHHGGRLAAARASYPLAPQPWVDLSTGINPHPYPAAKAANALRARLPDPEMLRRLEAVAARAFGVENPAAVVAVPGTESGLRLVPTLLSLPQSFIVAPTYGSHEDAWRQAGAQVQPLDIGQLSAGTGLLEGRSCALTIVNPNNPDGAEFSAARLLELHDVLAASGGALIVDEAFIEVAPEISVSNWAGTARAPRLVVLRSFGKFYGLAGLRLGFVICEPSIGERLRAVIGEWPISVDALEAGLAAYSDRAWSDWTFARLQRAADRLDALLKRMGFDIVGGTALYRLCRADDAPRRFEALAAAGILVRPFRHDATLLRFGLPGTALEWQRLRDALGATP